ncbi:DUF4192 domain-containing protein [Nocardioides exalbidus]|nr:DUF4192 domain-containing protein [Nocardioides exalbidus]
MEPTSLRLSARTPEDLAAFVPLALGFVPERSVVLVSIGPPDGMNARVTLPQDPDDVDDVVEALLRPVLRHGVREVVVVVYDDDTTVADEAAWSLHEELTAAGVRVRDVLRVHDQHWYAVLPGAPLAAYQGVPFSLDSHPFTAQGVLDGRVTHPSREALRATIATDADGVDRAAPALAGATALPACGLAALVRRHLGTGSRFSDAELAAVAVSLRSGHLRDEAWVWLGRPEARGAVELWSDAVRRLPTTHVAGAAAVLGFCAWLLGDGALAWCAIDRCHEAEPSHPLADLVAQLLDSATSPAQWDVLRPRLTTSGDPAA